MLYILFFIVFAGDDFSERLSEYLAKGPDVTVGIHSLLSDRTEKQLDILSHHRAANVAVYAAFEKCRRCDKAEAVTRRAEFVGYLSGRFELPIPTWWRLELLDFPSTERNRMPALKLKHAGFVRSNGLVHKKEILISRFDEAQIEGTVNNRTFSLNLDIDFGSLPEDDLGDLESFDYLRLQDDRQIFAFTGTAAADFFIYCQTKDGKELWRTRIRSRLHLNTGGRLGNRSGNLEIVQREDKVFVFGSNELGIFFHQMDINNGKLLSQFITHY